MAEVCSPITRRGSKAGSNPPKGPDHSHRGYESAADSVPNPSTSRASPVRAHSEEEPAASIKVTGPE